MLRPLHQNIYMLQNILTSTYLPFKIFIFYTMPMLILNSRTRLFLGLHSTTDYIGWHSDLTNLSFTVAGTVNDFHIISHHDSIHNDY